MTTKVYFDNAATTAPRPEVIAAMQETLQQFYGNPSSTHAFGRAARTRIEQARKAIAKMVHCHPSEIIFTSGGTEADNMILASAITRLKVQRIITAATEHHAVLHTVEVLAEKHGVKLEHVALDECGSPDMKALELLLQEKVPTLVSLMHINNEIGNRIDINALTQLCKAHGAWIHTDAVQSVGHWEWDLSQTKVDFLAAAAHKFHGPKGVGFAFIRKDTPSAALIMGGEQERGLRAGTEAVHNIVGMEVALQLATDHLEKERNYITSLKEYFVSQLRKSLPGVRFNGACEDADKSTYNLLNVCLPLPPEKASLLDFQMDLKGIACSRGSACQSGSSAVSHVLAAFLPEEELRKPSLRFSFSIYNTKEEIDYVVDVLASFVN